MNNTEVMQWLIGRIDEIEEKRESLTKQRFRTEFYPRLRELRHLIQDCSDMGYFNDKPTFDLDADSLDWGSKGLIGFADKRFKELKHKNMEWRSFYSGWLEGRVDMLAEFKGWKSRKR